MKPQHVKPAADIEGFRSSGDADRSSRLVSMAYLIQSVCNAYWEEAAMLMQRHGLMHKRLKTRFTNLSTAFDLFDKEVFSLVDDPEAQQQLMDDYDAFRTVCDQYMQSCGVAKVYVNMRTGRVVKADHPEATPCLVCKRKGDPHTKADTTLPSAENFGTGTPQS